MYPTKAAARLRSEALEQHDSVTRAERFRKDVRIALTVFAFLAGLGVIL